jgi:hypothetical protein
MGFEVFTSVNILILVFWFMRPCNLGSLVTLRMVPLGGAVMGYDMSKKVAHLDIVTIISVWSVYSPTVLKHLCS